MRPTVSETLRGVRRILQEIVLPEVANPFAASRVPYLVAALEDVERRWADVLPNLMEESDDLERLLRSAAAALQVSADPKLGELAGEIGRVLADQAPLPAYPSLAALEERSRHQRGLLTELIGKVERANRGPSSDSLQLLRNDIRQHLRKFLDRDL